MSKEVLFENEARAKLQKGVDIVADAVKVTMGPEGRAVLILKGDPQFTKDGVTVAQSIDKLDDPVEDMGASLVKNVAQRTNDEAGDGTTTATLLTQVLLKAGMQGVAQGINPSTIKMAYEQVASEVVTQLKSKAVPVKSKAQMKSIATISSRDAEIGEVIASIYDKVGKDGVITTEEVKHVGIEYEVVDGMEIDNGFLVPHFMTNGERLIAEIDKPYILVTSQLIRENADIGNILAQINATESKAIVIIAEDVQGEALGTMVVNKMQGILKTLVVKAPGFGDNKKEYLDDICAMTGATHISEETAMRVEETTIEQCGRADKVIAYKDRTIIVGGKLDKKLVKSRIAGIDEQLKETASNYAKSNLETRKAKLQGGVAVIKVGDVTEEASREKQYRIEDAVNATKAAIAEGVVEGGGMALYRIAESLQTQGGDTDYLYGMKAIQEALKEPARRILLNQNKKADVILAGNYKLAAEVIDPAKVERVALENAVSMVGLFLITEAVVYEPKKEPEASLHLPKQ